MVFGKVTQKLVVCDATETAHCLVPLLFFLERGEINTSFFTFVWQHAVNL